MPLNRHVLLAKPSSLSEMLEQGTRIGRTCFAILGTHVKERTNLLVDQILALAAENPRGGAVYEGAAATHVHSDHTLANRLHEEPDMVGQFEILFFGCSTFGDVPLRSPDAHKATVFYNSDQVVEEILLAALFVLLMRF